MITTNQWGGVAPAPRGGNLMENFDPFAILPDEAPETTTTGGGDTGLEAYSPFSVNPDPLLTRKPSRADNQPTNPQRLPTGRKINDQELIDRFNAGATGRELAAHFGCSPAAISKRLKRLQPGVPRAIDQLTEKQAAAVVRIVKGESPTNAVDQVYDTTSRASSKEIARKLMGLPQVQLAIEEEMNRAGLTRTYRCAKLAEHVDAADPGVSLRALDMSFRLADEYPAAKVKNVNLNIDTMPVDLSAYQ
ncbi:hypothetical protein Ppro_1365 [Pelobacter propionicus DSM 2379]|uniref:Uncharacterized protein n=2 Tax=Pelobacter propionicus TaxID=29543 RepID=A1ANR2_PELPD|nr:hypothetical protein Ppro_1365 [Pelobacter propionicus DSM 2379]